MLIAIVVLLALILLALLALHGAVTNLTGALQARSNIRWMADDGRR